MYIYIICGEYVVCVKNDPMRHQVFVVNIPNTPFVTRLLISDACVR